MFFVNGYPTSASAVIAAVAAGLGLFSAAGLALGRWGRKNAQNKGTQKSKYTYNAIGFAATGVVAMVVGVWILQTYYDLVNYNNLGSEPAVGRGSTVAGPPTLPAAIVIIAGFLFAVAVAGLVNAIMRVDKLQTSAAAFGACAFLTVFFGALALRYNDKTWYDCLDAGWVLVVGSGLYFVGRAVIAYGDYRVRQVTNTTTLRSASADRETA